MYASVLHGQRAGQSRAKGGFGRLPGSAGGWISGRFGGHEGLDTGGWLITSLGIVTRRNEVGCDGNKGPKPKPKTRRLVTDCAIDRETVRDGGQVEDHFPSLEGSTAAR